MKINKRHIESFIREKVHGEALSDAQIARLLNVATSTVAKWRNQFGIKPADKFERKFREKYSRHGKDAFEQFDAMVRDRVTLQEIGDYFGFSKEYARQVYSKRYGAPVSDRRHQRKMPSPAVERADHLIHSAQ